jgi:hypothetical protein
MSAISRRVIPGERSASPPAMIRIACRSSAGSGVLDQEVAGAGLQRLVDVLVGLVGGHDQHLDASQALVGVDALSGLQAVDVRHADVHQHPGPHDANVHRNPVVC